MTVPTTAPTTVSATVPASQPRPLQPLLHDAIVCVAAPQLVVSGADGRCAGGVHGVYAGDRRVVRRLRLLVEGADPEPVQAALMDDRARFVGVVRTVGEDRPDPPVIVDQWRAADAALQRTTVRNSGRLPVDLRIEWVADSDLADMSEVKRGLAPPPVAVTVSDGALCWQDADATTRVELTADPPADAVTADGTTGSLHWSVHLDPGESWTNRLDLSVTDEPTGAGGPVVIASSGEPPWSRPVIASDDIRLDRLVERSLDDLAGLLLADPDAPDDRFVAAGVPWFLTLFGRDSLWAARLLLPLGTDLAMSTLRVLARRQGERFDARSEEAPGKIMHEIRRAATTPEQGLHLPPLYFGTIDATPLFVSVLADAWRWGHDPAEVAALLPAVERALGWLVEQGDQDGDGFVEYVGRPGGLTNQGWKDSDDSVQFRDGRLADAPIALCEVQGYAYAAAHDGAALLDAFGRPGGDRLRTWADALAERFRDRFWVEDDVGRYPAIALDAEKKPVDTATSNIAHLLATGILDADECALVARRLAAPDLDCGFGLRTMSADAAGFNPLSYHGGSVWPHDTAIAVAGLAATGHGEVAGSLLRGLVEAAPAFDFRLPELYAGEQRHRGLRPVPYPAACRPQAWAAAAAVALLGALVGVRPDVPAGVVALAPMRPAPYAVEVRNLRLAGQPLSVRVDAHGTTVLAAPDGVRVDVLG